MPYATINEGTNGVADDIGTSPDAREYTSFASLIDVTADAATGLQRAARGFMVSVAGSGSVSVVTANGQTRVYNCTNLVGVFMPIGIKAINTATNVSGLIVFW